jgi:hypothetical protein
MVTGPFPIASSQISRLDRKAEWWSFERDDDACRGRARYPPICTFRSLGGVAVKARQNAVICPRVGPANRPISD